jgi:hypothetical protein
VVSTLALYQGEKPVSILSFFKCGNLRRYTSDAMDDLVLHWGVVGLYKLNAVDP